MRTKRNNKDTQKNGYGREGGEHGKKPRVDDDDKKPEDVPPSAGLFGSLQYDKDALAATVGSVLNAGNAYRLVVSVCPVVSKTEDGPVQRCAVMVLQFLRAGMTTECWCMKPGHLLDALRIVKILMPHVG
jgi:hypothetical protein